MVVERVRDRHQGRAEARADLREAPEAAALVAPPMVTPRERHPAGGVGGEFREVAQEGVVVAEAFGRDRDQHLARAGLQQFGEREVAVALPARRFPRVSSRHNRP